MRKSIPALLTAICAVYLAISLGCARHCPMLPNLSAPVNMIYDDDCDGDVDCLTTQPIIHNWIDHGFIKMWGMVSSASTSLGAPAMKVFQHYYNHDNLYSIGAWTPQCALRTSAPWAVAVVGQFDPGDVCTNYPNCGTILRSAVASYAASGASANSLVYVITGPLTCEELFRSTPGDSISALTGAQMEQHYIQKFVLMNSYAPVGIESNCQANPSACSAFFANVTAENGYPPVYVVPVNTGANRVTAPTPLISLPQTNPSAYAFVSIGTITKTGSEDALTVEYALFGITGWTLSADSTNLVDPGSGANTWNNSASGQHYLTTTSDPACFEDILNVRWIPSPNESAQSRDDSDPRNPPSERPPHYSCISTLLRATHFRGQFSAHGLSLSSLTNPDEFSR